MCIRDRSLASPSQALSASLAGEPCPRLVIAVRLTKARRGSRGAEGVIRAPPPRPVGIYVIYGS
eukprot:7113877-Pyramimonas_sp.AAC.3